MHSPAKTYEVLLTLARGGMGEVSIARERTGDLFERLVVLKTVLPHQSEDEQLTRALLDEARVLSQLQHPNIAQIYDVAFRDRTLCIVMEWLRGQNLAAIMRELRGAMPRENAVAIVLGAAAGLAHAHCATDSRGHPLGIVHRDVSPQNVFLTREGSVKVIDFGIALSAQRAQTTSHGVVKGKIAYMAPEQLQGIGADVRSDVWALGVVAWELLTGKRLFRRGLDVVDAVLFGPVPAPSSVAGDSDAELDAIVLGMLDRDLGRRTPTCAAVQDALMGWSRDRRVPTAHELAGWFGRLFGPEHDAVPAPGAEPTATVRLAGCEPELARSPPVAPRADPDSTATLDPPPYSIEARTATVDAPSAAATPSGAPTAPTSAPAVPEASNARDRSGRRWLWPLGALAMALAALVGAGMYSRSEPTASEPPPVTPVPVIARTVRFAVEGLPDGASIWLDGDVVAGASVEVPESRSTHLLEVRDARGEALLSRQLVADANVRIPLIALAPQPTTSTDPEPPEAPRPPRRARNRRSRSNLAVGIDPSYE